MGEVIQFPRPFRRPAEEPDMPAADYLDIVSRASAAARRMALGENASTRSISELRWPASDERFRRGASYAALASDLSDIQDILAHGSSSRARAAAVRVSAARRILDGDVAPLEANASA